MIISRGSVWKLTPYSERSKPEASGGRGVGRCWRGGAGLGLATARAAGAGNRPRQRDGRVDAVRVATVAAVVQNQTPAVE